MTDRDDKQAQLLADTFHADWSTGRAAGFARTAAAQVRRRRRMRGALALTGVAALIAATSFVAWRERAPVESAKPRVAASQPALLNPRGYEIISDDQLIAQLRDRPLLVVQRENGTREIVLLHNE